MKKLNRVRDFLSGVLVMALVMALVSPTEAMAVKSTWREAYVDFIEADAEKNLDLRYVRYQLIYIDDDDIPELWVDYGSNAAGGRICTYDGMKVNFEPIYSCVCGESLYIEKRGMFYTKGGWGGVYRDSAYQLKNGNFTIIGERVQEIPDWEDDYTISSTCYWGGESISEAQYQQYLSERFDFSKSITIDFESSFTWVDIYLELCGPFYDVGDTYYSDAISWAFVHDIASGTSASTFSPNMPCTRAQMMTFLWRVAEEPAPQNTHNPFSDISSDAYYYNAVLWAVEQGITNGTSDTTFSPDVTCTRAQAVTFLWRAGGSPSALSGGGFSDVADSAYYTNAVKWAVANGVTQGTSSTTFSPDADCTRAQIVTFLYRAYADLIATQLKN